MTFVWLSAPDLALTQLLVEIVTTVLLLLGLRWLPKRFLGAGDGGRLRFDARLDVLRHLGLFMAAATGMSLVAYVVMTRPMPE